jgi:WD40 repeat protein
MFLNYRIWVRVQISLLAMVVCAIAPVSCQKTRSSQQLSTTTTATPKLLYTLSAELHFRTSGIAFSPDGKTLAIVAEDGQLDLYHAESGKYASTLSKGSGNVPNKNIGMPISSMDAASMGFPPANRLMRFSPDGKLLAETGGSKAINLWEIKSKKVVRALGPVAANFRAILFSTDGKLMASAYHNGKIEIWNIANGKRQRLFQGHKGTIYGLNFSPDNTLLASGGEDKTLKTWDLRTGKLQRSLNVYLLASECSAIGFLPKGRTMFSVSSGGVFYLQLWDSKTGKLINTITSQDNGLPGYAISRDGKRFLWATKQDNVENERWVEGRIYDAQTGQLLNKVETAKPNSVLDSFALSPDGKYLAIASVEFGQNQSGGRFVLRVWRI